MSAAAAMCLYLDADYRPLRIEPWQRAIADFFTGKTEVVEYSADRMIQGVHTTHRMPAVVRVLRRFKRERMAIKFSRVNIYARDRFTCQYCAKRFAAEDLTFDHVVPRSHGGKTNWENIVACCGGPGSCNDVKANRTPAQAGMKLLRQPKKPFSLPMVTVKMDVRNMPPEWAGYWSDALEG